MPILGGKPPHPGDLIKSIRALAAAGRVSFTAHALDERMDERGIETDDVVQIPARGTIEGPVVPGKRPGEWKCLVVGKLGWTSREAGVATVVVDLNRVIVVTVEWMDP